MYFKQIAEIFDGRKTETRRVVKSNQRLVMETHPGDPFGGLWETIVIDIPGGILPHNAANKQRILYQAGRTYAVCPKRGQKAVGRIRITSIRQEPLHAITREGAIAEGIWLGANRRYQTSVTPDCLACEPVDAYQWLWMDINTTPGVRWEDNPMVFVIRFEVA